MCLSSQLLLVRTLDISVGENTFSAVNVQLFNVVKVFIL